MTEHAAFVQAILDAPDDDTPRLIFADWLEEHGDGARAEFIRLQCDRERLPAGDVRHRFLVEREQELLGAHWEAWVGPLASHTTTPSWAIRSAAHTS